MPPKNRSDALGSGASFTITAPAVAAARAIFYIQANLREVEIEWADLCAGTPAAGDDVTAEPYEWGLFNLVNVLVGDPITAGKTEQPGFNFTASHKEGVRNVADKRIAVVSYQAFFGRRGDSLVNAFGPAGVVVAGRPRSVFDSMCSAGRMRIPVGLGLFFSCLVTNRAITGNFFGREVTDSRPPIDL